MKAAVFHEPLKPLTIETIDIDDPIGKETIVRTVASGVCGSDAHIIDGFIPGIRGPLVLGHEAAGIVEEIGPDVSFVKPGDHVIICPSIWCGECETCLRGYPYLCENRQMRTPDQPARLSMQGKPVAQFTNVASFAERMMITERGLLKIEDELPLETAALIGCGILTGLGAVLRTAKPEAGSTIAVFGAGGVGLAAVQGAYIAGARTVISVDINEYKMATTKEFGATHAVDASQGDPVEAIREITGGVGVDYAFEAIGNTRTAEQAFACVRPIGGTAVLIGFFPQASRLDLPASDFISEKRLIGSRMGSNRFRLDMPAYLDLYKQGRLKLDELVTKKGKLEDVNTAFEDIKKGTVTRTVLTFD